MVRTLPVNVLARGAVTAGRGPGEDSVLVGQGDGQAINLDLGGHGELVVGHPGLDRHALCPLLDLIEGEDVLQGVHALMVGGRSEVGDGATPTLRVGDPARARAGWADSRSSSSR